MTTDKTYRGWSNHATWCVALHINKDQKTQEGAIERCECACEDARTCSQVKRGVWKFDDAKRYILADRLEAWVTCIVVDNFDRNPGFADVLRLDLLTSYLAQTNWDELARSFIESEAE